MLVVSDISSAKPTLDRKEVMDAVKGRAYRMMFSAASLVTLAVSTGAARKFG